MKFKNTRMYIFALISTRVRHKDFQRNVNLSSPALFIGIKNLANAFFRNFIGLNSFLIEQQTSKAKLTGYKVQTAR